MNWNNITYKQLQAIKDASNIEDETERMIAIAQAVFGDDIIELPINEFANKCKELEFLKDEIPTSIKVKNVTVNGREYYFEGMLEGQISTARYFDFQNYLKTNDEIKQYSVFFIPVGHKYNDGYDMNQVFEDIYDIPVPILMSSSFFFERQFRLFTRIFQHYSTKQIKKLKLPKEMKKQLIRIVESSNNLAFSHIS